MSMTPVPGWHAWEVACGVLSPLCILLLLLLGESLEACKQLLPAGRALLQDGCHCAVGECLGSMITPCQGAAAVQDAW